MYIYKITCSKTKIKAKFLCDLFKPFTANNFIHRSLTKSRLEMGRIFVYLVFMIGLKII